MSLLLIILVTICAYLLWRLLFIARGLRELSEAADQSQPLLREKPGGPLGGRDLDRLVESYNRLVEEKARISGTEDEHHGQIEALLGNLREAVAMVDADNTIVSANTALKKLVGLSGDPLGQRLDALFQGADFLQFIEAIRRQGKGERKELKVRINRTSHWLEVSAAPLQEQRKEGGPFTLFIFQDISQQKQLEKMRTEFVANVSHELGTPVTIIKGFAETLMEDQAILSAEEKNRFLEKIRNNSERLNRLLQDLLLLSRLESTQPSLHLEKISLARFLEEFQQAWLVSHPTYGNELLLDPVPELTIEADPLRLNQVLTNLLDNAARHAQEATEIRITAQENGGGLRLVVADNGEGIPQEDLPHIFQRFYRVDKGRARESGGTGLGLAIVKHIVVQHGGSISALSRLGEGTQIIIQLPVCQPVSTDPGE